jgi:hypothetical protein
VPFTQTAAAGDDGTHCGTAYACCGNAAAQSQSVRHASAVLTSGEHGVGASGFRGTQPVHEYSDDANAA